MKQRNHLKISMMKINVIFGLLSVVLFGCLSDKDEDSRELMDDVYDQRHAFYTVYYSSANIEEAQRALEDFLRLLKGYEEAGISVESLLWNAHYRLHQIYEQKGERVGAIEMLQAAKRYYLMQGEGSVTTEVAPEVHMEELVRAIDEGRTPKWKRETIN